VTGLGVASVSSVSSASGGLTVSLQPCPAPEQLAPEWQALEAQAEPSFFTSWAWIACWLAHLRPEQRPALVRVHRGPELVGLGVLLQQASRRLRWWPSLALHLHATGQSVQDDITTEHNGWLARRDLVEQVEAAVAMQLWALAPRVDQIRVPGVSARHDRWRGFAAPVREVREHTEKAYRVDLAQVRACGRAYLDSLGSPTRSSIRRSLRLYEGLGPLALTAAATVDQGLAFLARLKHFHQAAWQARGRPGAFANPLFEDFHQRLVRSGLPAGQVQLLRLTAGSEEVGYLYNFVHGGQVLAYQSGFHFGLTERNHHPGLVTHAQAVQQALVAGLDGYDFLAGEARYKQQLANQTYPMTTFTLQRPSLGWRLEQLWRGCQDWRQRLRSHVRMPG
jgi:CelD/BcsL family acetyltransferase involved in cellulose biosynthesis